MKKQNESARSQNSSPPPILRHKRYDQPSVFTPENLLREARRQRAISSGQTPRICVLDPDGDIVRNLLAAGQARLNPHWACYHTQMYDFEYAGIEFGIVGCVVGASFAVLVAEELFVSGCQLLVSITSSGQISAVEEPPFFVLIEKALRDEGTSYHYLPPSEYAYLDHGIADMLDDVLDDLSVPVYQGATWTTDAPFRETAYAVEQARTAGIIAVEMEAAALYAFAQVRRKPVVCFAYVTNQMGTVEQDFEKGEAGGSRAAMELISVVARRWLSDEETRAHDD